MDGKKTVIIGLDLRKPKLQDYYPISNDIGASNYLAGKAKISEVILDSGIENLSIIPAGIVPPNPSELLLNERMGELIVKLKEDFDFIILDTPPIGLVTDAIILAEHSNINLFVARQHYSEIDMIKQLNGYYRDKKLNNLSIVFNDVQNGDGYGYGYGYFEDETNSKGILSRVLGHS